MLQEECKRQARADPHNHKIIRPSKPEGVAFLVAKIKRERAAAKAEAEAARAEGAEPGQMQGTSSSAGAAVGSSTMHE